MAESLSGSASAIERTRFSFQDPLGQEFLSIMAVPGFKNLSRLGPHSAYRGCLRAYSPRPCLSVSVLESRQAPTTMAKSLKERIIELREIHNRSKDDLDVDDESKQPKSQTRWGRAHGRSRRRRRGGGWKRTLHFGAIWASMILILNLVLVIWASTRRSPEGRSVLYAGDCGRTKQISSWVHVLINMLSTGMLGASHFAMVCILFGKLVF
jgi:hypothetical protein